MNEQEQNSQLSALFDNQLPPAQSELVIRRALKDPGLRKSWERYALIGACVRSEPLHRGVQPDVAERVRARLAAETEYPKTAPALPAYAGNGRGFSMLGRGALGGAIAAGVAVMALVVVRSMSPDVAVSPMQVAELQQPASQPVTEAVPALVQVEAPVQVAAVREAAPPSYTTPVDNSPASRISGNMVNYYMVAHSEVAASAMQLLPPSAVMNGNYDITQGAVEMTEAEIGAHR